MRKIHLATHEARSKGLESLPVALAGIHSSGLEPLGVTVSQMLADICYAPLISTSRARRGMVFSTQTSNGLEWAVI